MYPLSRKSTIICTYVKCLIETAWRYLSEKMNSTSIHKMIFDSPENWFDVIHMKTI